MNESSHQLKAEAAIEKAKVILAANETQVTEFSRSITDGNNRYTVDLVNHSDARLVAQDMLMEVFNAMPVSTTDSWYSPEGEWMQAEAAKLGITLE